MDIEHESNGKSFAFLLRNSLHPRNSRTLDMLSKNEMHDKSHPTRDPWVQSCRNHLTQLHCMQNVRNHKYAYSSPITLLEYMFMVSVMSIVNTTMQDGNTQDTTSKMGYTASSRPRLQFGHESKLHLRFARTAFSPGHKSESRNSHDDRAMRQIAYPQLHFSRRWRSQQVHLLTNLSETWS